MGRSRTSEQNIALQSLGQQEVQGLLEQLVGGALGGINAEQLIGGFDPQQSQELFNQIVGDPARTQFQQKTVPGIQQSFISQNAGSSSAANRALSQAGSDLEAQLAQGQGQFFLQQQQNALANLLGLGQLTQGAQTQQPVVTQRPSQFSDVASILGAIAPIAGAAFGGPVGAAAGAAGGQALNAFARGR